jgi:hypothetical protein
MNFFNSVFYSPQQTESSCPTCDQSTAHRFLNDPRNNNSILCYFCGDTSHTITNCIHYKKQQDGIKERREAHELNRHVQHLAQQELAQQFNAPNTQQRSNFSNNNQQQRSNYYTQRNNYSNSNSTNNNN